MIFLTAVHGSLELVMCTFVDFLDFLLVMLKITSWGMLGSR